MINLADAGLYILIIVILSSFLITLSMYILIQDYKQKRKTKSNLSIDSVDFISAKEVQSDGVLPVSSALLGVISLEIFARKQKPKYKYIIGVNRGGWLLSTYLAHRLDIDRDHLLKFDSAKNTIAEILEDIKIKSDNILLVDDISRTGRSIEIAIEFLKKQFPDCKITTAVLAICNKNSDREYINFYPYYTYYPDVQLPWSSEERKREARKAQLESSAHKVTNLADKNSLSSKTPVLRIAESDKSDAEGIDIAIGDIELLIKIFNDMDMSIFNAA